MPGDPNSSTNSKSVKFSLVVLSASMVSSTILFGCSQTGEASREIQHSRSKSSQTDIANLTVADFGPFAKDLTSKILSYDSPSYKAYIEEIKPKMSPKAFEKLKTGKLIPSSEEEMKAFSSRVSIVSVNESEPISYDAKTSSVVAKVGFVAEMKSSEKPEKMKSEMVYKLGIRQKTGKPVVIEVGQTDYQKVE